LISSCYIPELNWRSWGKQRVICQ